MVNFMALVILGCVAGVASGLVGIGGGIIIVPALVLLFGFPPQLAQGTTLPQLAKGLLRAFGYTNIFTSGRTYGKMENNWNSNGTMTCS